VEGQDHDEGQAEEQLHCLTLQDACLVPGAQTHTLETGKGGWVEEIIVVII